MTAAKQYEKVWNSFIKELTSNSTASLSSLQRRLHVNHSGMKRWMGVNGLSVKEAKRYIREHHHHAIGKPKALLPEATGGLFLPMITDQPTPQVESCDILSEVSFTLPNGTQVNIKRGSAQAVMLFLKFYQKENLPCLD